MCKPTHQRCFDARQPAITLATIRHSHISHRQQCHLSWNAAIKIKLVAWLVRPSSWTFTALSVWTSGLRSTDLFQVKDANFWQIPDTRGVLSWLFLLSVWPSSSWFTLLPPSLLLLLPSYPCSFLVPYSLSFLFESSLFSSSCFFFHLLFLHPFNSHSPFSITLTLLPPLPSLHLLSYPFPHFLLFLPLFPLPSSLFFFLIYLPPFPLFFLLDWPERSIITAGPAQFLL